MLKSTSQSSRLLTLINAPLAIMHEESSGQSDCACSNVHVKKPISKNLQIFRGLSSTLVNVIPISKIAIVLLT
jgi:hypothetical protein